MGYAINFRARRTGSRVTSAACWRSSTSWADEHRPLTVAIRYIAKHCRSRPAVPSASRHARPRCFQRALQEERFPMGRSGPPVLRGGIFLVLLLLAACSGGGDDHKRPATQVGFVVVQPTSVPVTVSLGGRTVAYETSEVRPQVNGIIRKRLFTEGSTVRAGQPLYLIDPSLSRAAPGQGRCRAEFRRARDRADQPALYQRQCANFRPDRALAGDHRRAR